MRYLAIGDIHGCSRAFELLLTVVQPQPEDIIITLQYLRQKEFRESDASQGGFEQSRPIFAALT